MAPCTVWLKSVNRLKKQLQFELLNWSKYRTNSLPGIGKYTRQQENELYSIAKSYECTLPHNRIIVLKNGSTIYNINQLLGSNWVSIIRATALTCSDALPQQWHGSVSDPWMLQQRAGAWSVPKTSSVFPATVPQNQQLKISKNIRQKLKRNQRQTGVRAETRGVRDGRACGQRREVRPGAGRRAGRRRGNRPGELG
jgi:hypothetical protein